MALASPRKPTPARQFQSGRPAAIRVLAGRNAAPSTSELTDMNEGQAQLFRLVVPRAILVNGPQAGSTCSPLDLRALQRFGVIPI